MSCGLKNQNNQKGGVHLTERTCSPYNPIIRLMVDDCLGLPIYPVTSVDAVIDEEGNTLRKLLDELLDKVKSGLSDVNIEITKIRNLLEQLEERVVDKEAFDALKKLVYAISSVSNISLSLDILEQNIYEIDPEHGQTTTPYIVSYIKNLKESFEDFVSFVCEVLSFNGDVSYSDVETEDGKIKIINEIIKLLQAIGGDPENSLISQIEKLTEMQGYLKNLIVAIANFDTSKDIGQFSELLGLTSSDERTRLIEIIYQITSLIEQIGGTSGGDSIIERLRILKERVDTLEEEAKTHASLDEDVLKNTPSGIFESQSRKYKVLSRILYPPTSAYFVKTNSDLKFKSFNYLGFLNCVELPDNRTVDVYPIGHTDTTKGYPLFKRTGTPGNYEYEAIMHNGVLLRAGKGAFSPDDYLTIIKLVVQSDEPALDYMGRDILDNNNKNILYKNLCIQYLGDKYPVGDINLDEETNITDANNVIHELVRGTQIDNPTLPILSTESSQISASPIQSTPTDLVKAWLIFEDGSSSVLYPCIDGKLYTDLYTNSVYRFKLEGPSGKMVKVSDIRFIGNDEISVEPEDVTITDLDNNNEVTDAYTQINIKGETGVKVNSSINGLSISYPTIIKPNKDAADEGEYYVNTKQLKIYAKPSATKQSDATDPYSMDDLIIAIDKLLYPNGIPEVDSEETKKLIDRILLNKCNIYVNKLLDEILDLREEIKSLTPSENQQGTTVYYASDDGVSLLVVTGPKEELAKISTCDINGDGVFDIKDIADLIDILLAGSGDVDITTNLTDVGASLYRKAETGPDEQIILSASNKDDFLGKIFKVDYGEIKPSEGNNGNNTENNSEEDDVENTNIGGSNSSEGDEESTPFRYDEYYFDSNGAFLSVIPKYNMSVSYNADTKKITVELLANGKPISVLEASLNVGTKNVANESIESVAAPVFLGELVDEPSGDYPTNLHQGNNLSDKFNPMQISAPLGTFDLELFLEDYLLFMDETANNTQNVSPIAVISHETRKKFIDILNETPFIDREELIETYKVAKYFKCFDVPNEEIKHILLVVSFDIIDPMLPITEENIETVTEIEIVDSTPIEENVNYYIENYGLTLRFVYEDNVLIPIVVSLEQRKAPASRVIDSVDETVVDIRPNEFLEIPEISSTDLYFDVTNVVNTFGHELLRICGTFVGVQDLNIHFITGTNHSISVPQSSSMTVNETNHSILTPENLPPIVDGTLYTYEIFNNTFRYWESSSR